MCDTFCSVGPDGTRFAKNSDRAVGEVQVVESFAPRRPGGELRTQYLGIPDAGAVAVVGSRPTWLWGFEHGVNEHGVAIGNERVWTSRDDQVGAPALIGMDLVRLGLERGTSASAAVEAMTGLLERHGQGGAAAAPDGEGYFSSFLVADPSSAWVLETCGRTWFARRWDGPGTTCAISNRLGLDAEWSAASADVAPGTDVAAVFGSTTMPTGHADVRLAVTRRAAASSAMRGPLAPTLAALRDHGGRLAPLPARRASATTGEGVTVCMHLRGYEVTAASMVVDLPVAGDGCVRGWAALGSPCVSVYVPFTVGRALPACLGDPACWALVDALRARVERVTDRSGPAAGAAVLGAVRSVLDRLGSSVGHDDAADEVDRAVRDAFSRATAVAMTASLADIVP